MHALSADKKTGLPDWLVNLMGWLPAIIFPGATLIQLIKIIQTNTATGVSIETWLLFSVANVGMYLYTEKYFAPQALALLLTAALQASIVFAALLL